MAKVLAALRQGVNETAGVADRRYADDPDAIHALGATAEIAWHKMCGTYPDFSCQPRSGTWDAIRDGKRIDIKATDRPDGNLLASIKKKIDDADVYVLAVVSGYQLVDFVGFATADQLIRDENIKDLGRGKTYFLHRSALNEFRQKVLA